MEADDNLNLLREMLAQRDPNLAPTAAGPTAQQQADAVGLVLATQHDMGISDLTYSETTTDRTDTVAEDQPSPRSMPSSTTCSRPRPRSRSRACPGPGCRLPARA